MCVAVFVTNFAFRYIIAMLTISMKMWYLKVCIMKKWNIHKEQGVKVKKLIHIKIT